MNVFADLFANSKLYHFKKSEIILRPDDTPSGVYLIESGYVRIYSLSEDGTEKIHIIYKKGDLFPYFWIFEGKPLTKYYEAMEDVTAKRVSKDDFLNFIHKDPTAFSELIQRLIKVINIYENRIDSLGFTKTFERLISQLIFLAQEYGPIPITHKDLAASIAMTRESVSRGLELLEKKNLIHYEGHLIVVNDIEKLREELTNGISEK